MKTKPQQARPTPLPKTVDLSHFAFDCITVEAERRDIDTAQLAARLLEAIAKDNLFNAGLDDAK
jgi:hypothetical protein